MNILVCIKEVPDDSVDVKVESGLPIIDEITPVINAFDTYSLEMAVRLKEKLGGKVTVVSIGNEEVKNSLKNCLAVGADEAVLVKYDDYKNLNSRDVATALKEAICKLEIDEKFDLICLGKESTDTQSSSVGIYLSEELNVGVITNVIEMEVNNNLLEAKSQTDFGYRIIETKLPSVVTINKPDYDPRYPTIKSKMAARRKEISEIEIEIIPNKDLTIISNTEPPKRQSGIKIQEEEIEDSVKKAIEIMVQEKIL